MSGILDRQTHPELETWRALLRRSLRAIDEVRRRSASTVEADDPPWTETPTSTAAASSIRLGGGTVLSALWGHRYSQDVDLFTHDAQLIGFLSPRLNDDIVGLMGATDYQDSGNAVKFIYGPGKGSIDIVAAADILPDAKPTLERWEGYQIEIDDPAEIIAKKLFHRGDRATVRDYVDLVEGSRQMPELVSRLARPLRGTIRRTLAVARETSDQHIAEGLSRIRFIRPAPEVASIRAEAVKVLERIAATPPGDGGKAAFLASRLGVER